MEEYAKALDLFTRYAEAAESLMSLDTKKKAEEIATGLISAWLHSHSLNLFVPQQMIHALAREYAKKLVARLFKGQSAVACFLGLFSSLFLLVGALGCTVTAVGAAAVKKGG